MAQLKGGLNADWLKLSPRGVVDFIPFPHRFNFRGIMDSRPWAHGFDMHPGAFNPHTGAKLVPRSVVADVREKALLSADQVERRLIKKGWGQIGKGARSYVYGNPKHPDIVVKVNYREDTWPAYIHWALKRGELGRKAPMVYSMAALDRLGYVAVMERLQEISVYEYSEGMADSDYEKAARRACQDNTGNDGCTQNTMKRANGELVLTDPWYGYPDKPVKPWSFKKWLRTPSHRLLYPTLSPLGSLATVTPEPIQPSIKGRGNGWLTGDWKEPFPLASKGPFQAF